MMDAIVQLIRNALCCVKDLKLFEETFIYDASYTGQLLGSLSEPMDKTIPLELAISVTQLYACLSITKSGITLLTTSVGKMRRIVRIVEARMSKKPEDWTQADRILSESLIREATVAFRNVFVGFLVAPIGIAFWWLFLNSFHITETDWFGGLPALIHALTVMEVCLLPLLFFMVKDGHAMLQKSKKTKDLVETLQSGKVGPTLLSIQTYEAMTGWTPFWESGVSIFAGPVEDEEKQTELELQKVRDTLATWFSEEKKGEKEDKLREAALVKVQNKLEASIPVTRMEGYREFLYFILNFFAFYGYLIGIITYYYDNEEAQPYHIQTLKFGYSNSDAEWYGNFGGDLMWTVEPIVILVSPILLRSVKQAEKKEKAD